MTTDVQMMSFRVLLPDHPEVSTWFMSHWSLRGAAQGIKAGYHVVPTWENARGLVIAVADGRGERVGMVLFEEIDGNDAIVHTALRTFGSRTDHAFKSALQMARQHGYNRFYYAFSSRNRSAYGLMKRSALLADSVAVQPEWATCPWIFGGFN